LSYPVHFAFDNTVTLTL